MKNKKVLQKRTEKAERARSKRVLRAHQKGEALREKVSSYKGPKSNLNLTSKQADRWATKRTGISPNQGKKNDSRSGRTLGRYIKGKI
jgi:hypothetical protein